MNGIIAAAFWASSLLSVNLLQDDVFKKTSSLGRQTANLSLVQFQKETVGSELGYSYTAPISYGPFQPSYAVSITDQRGVWFGGGFSNIFMLSEKDFVSLSFIPGIYSEGNDEDLGGWLMFRSGIEFGRYLSESWIASVSYDHRSSGDLWVYNPGMETIQFRLGRIL